MTDQPREPLVRVSLAIDGELLDQFDRYVLSHHYDNRSEAMRGLIRSALIEQAVATDDQPVLGVITLVYDHHAPNLSEKLTELQHGHLDCVVTTTHVHLDAHRCLEMVILRGEARVVRHLAEQMTSLRGVENGRYVLTAAEPLTTTSEHRHQHHG